MERITATGAWKCDSMREVESPRRPTAPGSLRRRHHAQRRFGVIRLDAEYDARSWSDVTEFQ